MAKYYIESGDVSFVVSACDAEGAALWAMHRIIDSKINDWESLAGESVLDDGYSRQIDGVPQPFLTRRCWMGWPSSTPKFGLVSEGLAMTKPGFWKPRRSFTRGGS